MSAIAGIFCLDGRPVEGTNLACMVETLAHRGPNGVGVWQQGSIGLGHRLLWTTPESLYERQPLSDPISMYTIVADARIDNREELSALVNLDERPFAEFSDSYLILRAYEKWGESCPEKLLGDFAFAIWDERRQQLFCARDHFGVKPFYYFLSKRVFIFATELKAILCWPEMPCRLNEVRVADYLQFGDYDTTSTFYQHILRLSPSHRLVVKPEGVSLQRYWCLDPAREVHLDSDQAYADTLRDLFTEAVHCRLRSAFPVGSMLSGGLDSSSIACVAHHLLAQNGGGRLYTFSALHDKVPESDERQFIYAVLAQDDYLPQYLHADDVSPLIDLERVLWHQDEACRAGNLYANWCLYGIAEKQGVRVILDGFDGDSTISHGLGLLVELASAGQWLTLSREVIAYARKTNSPWAPPLWAWLRQYGLRPMIAKYSVLAQLQRTRRVLLPRMSNLGPTHSVSSDNRPFAGAALKPEFSQRMGMKKRHHARPNPSRTDRETQYQRLTDPGMAATLEVLNKSAAAFSVEVRFPFWDKRLVEFCLAVPATQKMVGGWTRMIMRRAMAGILPREVQWRGGKANMHPSFARGLLTFEQARLEQVIQTNPSVIEPYVDLPTLRNAYTRYRTQQATEYEVNALWRTLSLAVWLQHTGLTVGDKDRKGISPTAD